MPQSVTAMWRDQIGARELVYRLELVDETGVTVRSTDLDTDHPITITGGQVSHDRSRNIWGSASCQLLVPWDASTQILELLPATPGAPLSPIGGISFRVSAGYRYPDGMVELVYCGRFDIDECEITETAGGVVVDLSGVDLFGRVDVADITAGFDIAYGGRIIDSAKKLITDVIPWMTFEEDPTTQIAGRWAAGDRSNRLANVRYMMLVLGFEAFPSMDGMSVKMRRRPTTQDSAAWVYTHDEMCDVPMLSASMDRKQVYNGVIATGENPNTNDPPVRAEAWITDTSDPTHYDPGPPVRTVIGPRPWFFTSPWILTQADAVNAANVELERIRGLMQRVRFQVATNPAINPGDVIDVTRESLGIVGRYIVESVTFSFDSSMMTVVCEERRV